MLKNDVIYYLLFRFRNINLSNISDIDFVINIIIVIATTLLKALIIITLVFKLVIVIVFDVVDIIIIIFVVFEKSVFKFIAFDFDIKGCFTMNASLDKS